MFVSNQVIVFSRPSPFFPELFASYAVLVLLEPDISLVDSVEDGVLLRVVLSISSALCFNVLSAWDLHMPRACMCIILAGLSLVLGLEW
jgi:hypothetical protein